MNRTVLSTLVLAATAGMAHAEVIEQSFSYLWTSNDPLPEFAFQAFDDMSGTRDLVSVRLGFEGTIQMELTARTYEDALGAGEWFVEATHTVVAYFNDGPELLQGLGGQWLADVTGDLGAGNNGEPGTPHIVLDTYELLSVIEVDSSFYPDFHGDGMLGGIMAGFYDGVVTPPDNGQYVEVLPSFLSQDGTVTLMYEYVNVPGPGGLAALGACGFAIGRRRR
jgi:hypothetical protein